MNDLPHTTNLVPPLPSPCISVCQMDAATGLCEGCTRTLNEIAAWSGYSEREKRAVWLRIEQRRGGGDSARTSPSP